ncbi:UvrD-like helicase ATP-binding domain-containing protein [Physcia stellaris]|nr:UvrD-like helicase ATP-binding domain-containing protein [Physcia stellaris]
MVFLSLVASTSKPAPSQDNSFSTISMDSHPLLRLLAREEQPPFRTLQATAALLAGNPDLLADLMGDLSDDLLALLETKADRFNRILLELGAHITDKSDFSKKFTPFVQYLLHSTEDMLDQGGFHDLFCTALRLCSANRDRWQLIREILGQGQTMETLILSSGGDSQLLQWFLSLREGDADASVLTDWTQRVVSLVDACSSDHGISDTLNRWRKIGLLRHALQQAISSKRNPKDSMDHYTTLLFVEFGLQIPGSQSMCQNHLDVLSRRETMLVLRRVLASYPCGLCQRIGHSGTALPKIANNVANTAYEYDMTNDSYIWNAKRLGEWEIVLSSQAYQRFRSLEGSFKTREALSMKLKGVAAGYLNWRMAASSRETLRIPLQIAKGRANIDFLCQVDLAPGPELNMEQQVIRVWAIGPQEIFNDIIDEVAKFQEGFSQKYVDECLQVGTVFRGKRSPVMYPRSENSLVLREPADLDIRLMNQEFIDMFNKSFTITEDMLQSIVHQDFAAEYPFDMSEMEMQIVRHSGRPTLIMGRSGTGKTACLVFKMVHKDCAVLSSSPENRAKQVCISSLYRNQDSAHWYTHPAKTLQILLTRSETLADKLAQYSARLIRTLSKGPTVSERSAQGQQQDQRTLFDLDLSDFPFVCTYGRFLHLLKGAMDLHNPLPLTGVSKSDAPANMVDFKAFRHQYWPHIPLDLRKHFSADLVFGEIMGTIKGSIETCRTFRSLIAPEYEGLSVRVAPNFPSSHDRSKVFRIYQQYEKLKTEAGATDSIDFVVSLLRRLHSDPHMRSRLASCFHDFYVDEVQDLRCVEIFLLLTLGNDPRGFHFAGDTAQGISQDSTFRFQDVKALFHNHFGPQSTAAGQKDLANPHLFILSRNYRSHQGILSLASSVIELLFRNFPDTVDRLEPELGTLVGPIPDLLLGCDPAILLNRPSGDSVSPHVVLFGAEQVILTRDEEQKAKLVSSIGEAALVLTILQAKGMEFEDVILFNFFGSTPDPVGWRSIQRSTMDESSKFDAIKHATLCSELKNLYVAITRARIRFVFIEESEDNAQPFIDLMTLRSALPLIEVTSATSPKFAEKIQVLKPRNSSDPHRWAAYGQDFMTRGDYAVATVCFRRADQPLKAKIAETHLKEVEGVELEAKGEGAASKVKFEEAVAAFQEMSLIADTIRVLIRLKKIDDAADLWYQSGHFEEAALLFEQTSNHQRASNSWHEHGNFEKAIICLRNGSLHYEMVAYLTDIKAHLDPRNFLRHQRVVKLLLKQQKISLDFRGLAIGLLGNVHEQEAFYLEYEMIESLIELYEEQGLSSKLLLLCIQLGQYEKAFDLASSIPCGGESVIGKAQLSDLTTIVWIDRIASGLTDSLHVITDREGDRSWELAYKTLRVWDPSRSEKEILSMNNDLVIRDYLCLYVATHMERIINMTKLSDIPYDLLRHALMTIKLQGTEPSGPLGVAVLLCCGVHRNFSSSQQYTLRPWSPLRDFDCVENGESLPEAAVRWIHDKLSSAIMRASDLGKEFLRVKWPTRCINFLFTGICKFRSKTSFCRYHHGPVTGSTAAEFLHDILTANTVLCEMNSLYNQRLMPEDVSRSFLGMRRHWLERLGAGLSFVSAFEQDTSVMNAFTEKLGTEEILRTVASTLEDHLFYRVGTDWGAQPSLGYIFEQLDLANHLSRNVKQTLIKRTTTRLRRQAPSTHAALKSLDLLQARMSGANARQYFDALLDYLHGPQGIMKLDWNAFEVFHCHTARFEEMALYLLLQIAQSSIMIPRSWVDVHLYSILRSTALTDTPDFQQRSVYRDALVMLLQAFIELLKFINTPLEAGKKFLLCGREYPTRILQQRNCELLAIIVVNLLAVPALCPPGMIRSHWEAMIRIFELPTVKAHHLVHKVGDINELRKLLMESHQRYQGKNPLLIVNILDGMSPHPFTAFQRANGLSNESLATIRKTVASIETPGSKSNEANAAETNAEQAARDINAARRIWTFWQKLSPRLRARKAFAATANGRLISKLDSLSKSCSPKLRHILFSYGSEVFPLLNSLDYSISALKKRALLQLDTAGVECSEALDIVLEAVTVLGEKLRLHHERLSDESVQSLIRTKDGDGLLELLKAEVASMGEDMGNVASQNEMLDGMVEKEQ